MNKSSIDRQEMNLKRILEENKAERHIRGGEATRIKYKKDERKAG